MKIKTLAFNLFLLMTIGISCKKDSNYYVQEINPNIKLQFQRFDQDFNQMKYHDIDEEKEHLSQKYPLLFDIYNQGIIRIGSHKDAQYNFYAHKFLNDSIYVEVYDTVQQHFTSMKTWEQSLSEALRRYNAIFPMHQIPAIYTHISGFNEPIVVADSILSISLENYLGPEHEFYKRLGTYDYLLKHRNPDHLVCDAMRGWISSELPQKTNGHLLDRIIEEGKTLFILQQILPEEEIHRCIGISKSQMQWCEKYTADTWQYMIEEQHLFSTQKNVIAKYVQDGPFFSFVGSGSSPMVGKHIGWRIVIDYMKHNPEVDIKNLIAEQNSQSILEKSNFKPQ